MRRVAILATLGALAVPSVASAGFDNPTEHAPLDKRAAEVVIPGKHCSKISNPFECTHIGKAVPVPQKPSNPYADKSCDWARVMYIYHHPPGTGKPWQLEAFTGCRLWRADLRFHSALARMGVDDSVQERLESLVLRAISQLLPIGEMK